MSIENNNTINDRNVGGNLFSVRDPKNTWMVKIVMFFVIVFSLDLEPLLNSEIVKLKNTEWAEQWIAVNNLNAPYYVSENAPSNWFAQASVSTPAKLAPLNSSTQKTPITETVISKNRSENYLALSSTERIPVLEVSNSNDIYVTNYWSESAPVQSNNEEYYQKLLQLAYETSFESQFKEQRSANKNVSWLAQGNIGPQVQNGIIQQPVGNSYANAIGMDNVSSEAVGVGQGVNSSSFMAMVNVGVTFENGFEILSGVNYSQTDGSHQAAYDSEVERTQTIYTSVATPQSNGSVKMETISKDVTYTNYFADTISSNYRVSNIEIPLTVKYTFGKSKLNYFLSSGVSASIGSSYQSSFESLQVGDGHISETKYGMNAVNLLLGVGIQYKASSSVSIHISPGYKYGIPVSSNSVYQSNVSSIGLFTGLSYYFR